MQSFEYCARRAPERFKPCAAFLTISGFQYDICFRFENQWILFWIHIEREVLGPAQTMVPTDPNSAYRHAHALNVNHVSLV